MKEEIIIGIEKIIKEIDSNSQDQSTGIEIIEVKKNKEIDKDSKIKSQPIMGIIITDTIIGKEDIKIKEDKKDKILVKIKDKGQETIFRKILKQKKLRET